MAARAASLSQSNRLKSTTFRGLKLNSFLAVSAWVSLLESSAIRFSGAMPSPGRPLSQLQNPDRRLKLKGTRIHASCTGTNILKFIQGACVYATGVNAAALLLNRENFARGNRGKWFFCPRYKNAQQMSLPDRNSILALPASLKELAEVQRPWKSGRVVQSSPVVRYLIHASFSGKLCLLPRLISMTGCPVQCP